MRRLASSVLALVTVLPLASCIDSTGPGGEVTRITELPRDLSVVEREVLSASNDFAFDLAGELLPENPGENLFYSPLSASMLLGMVLNGADGDTYAQMQSALGFEDLTQEEINQAYHDLVELLVGLDPTVTVEVGNSVWSQEGFPFLPDFIDRVTTSFDAEVAEVDFDDPATLDRINDWVKEATDGEIEDIFKRLPHNVVMVLLNAIYFQGDWTVQFDEAETTSTPFTRPDGSTVTVDMMEQTEAKFPFRRYEDVSVGELPYGGEAFAMTVVVPHEGVNVNDVVAGLTNAEWSAWLDGLTEHRVTVRLPRFELEWQAELNDPLRTLGMTDAFDPGAADFTRLVPGGGVWLGVVKQRAFVKVDEKGTTAAAVTAGTTVTSVPPSLTADRPFLFVLRERLSGTILFMGVVNDPTA